MRALTKNFDFWGMGPEMKAPLTVSVVFHIALFIFSLVGLPFVARTPLTLTTPPIMIEFVEIDKITQTNKPAPPAPKAEEKKPEEPPPPRPESKAAPDLLSPPPQETLADAVPLPTPPKEELKKPAPPKKAPPAPKKPVPPKAEAKPKTEDFQSLLKNLVAEPAPASEVKEKLNNDSSPSPEGQMAPTGEHLTISEEDALRHQIAQCWNVMAGAKFAEDLVVEVRVSVNPDRTVNQATIIDQGRYNRDTHFRAAADAAMRALRNTRCSPLMLPPDKYEQWKVTTIRFDPREML